MVVREGCWALVAVCGWWWAFIAIRGGGHLTCLWCSFHGVTWPSTGRGGVTWRVLAANRQWVVDSGGAGLVGWVVIDTVRLLTVSIQNDNVVPHQSVLHGYHVAFSNVARLTRGVVCGSGAMGCGFCVVVCRSLPLVVVIIRQSWPFVGQLSSCVVAVICWAMAVVCCAVVIVWQPGLFAVVGVA